MTRDKILNVRLNETERRMHMENAALLDMKPSEVVRKMIRELNEKLKKETP